MISRSDNNPSKLISISDTNKKTIALCSVINQIIINIHDTDFKFHTLAAILMNIHIIMIIHVLVLLNMIIIYGIKYHLNLEVLHNTNRGSID